MDRFLLRVLLCAALCGSSWFTANTVAGVKIGNCEVNDLTLNAAACVSLFFKPYREQSSRTCEMQAPSYFNCVFKIYDICIVDAVVAKAAKDAIQKAHNAANLTQKICVDGMATKDVDPKVIAMCNSGYPAKYRQCVAPFTPKYQKNKGDPELCGLYSTTMGCVVDLAKNSCSGDAINAAMGTFEVMSHKLANPFCSPSQGGPDTSIIMNGTLLKITDNNNNNSGSATTNRVSFAASLACIVASVAVILGVF